jgi:hypothetical protein
MGGLLMLTPPCVLFGEKGLLFPSGRQNRPSFTRPFGIKKPARPYYITVYYNKQLYSNALAVNIWLSWPCVTKALNRIGIAKR